MQVAWLIIPAASSGHSKNKCNWLWTVRKLYYTGLKYRSFKTMAVQLCMCKSSAQQQNFLAAPRCCSSPSNVEETKPLSSQSFSHYPAKSFSTIAQQSKSGQYLIQITTENTWSTTKELRGKYICSYIYRRPEKLAVFWNKAGEGLDKSLLSYHQSWTSDFLRLNKYYIEVLVLGWSTSTWGWV